MKTKSSVKKTGKVAKGVKAKSNKGNRIDKKHKPTGFKQNQGYKQNQGFNKKHVARKNGVGGSNNSKFGYRKEEGPATAHGDSFRNSYDESWRQVIKPDGRRWYEFEDPVEESEEEAKPMNDAELKEIEQAAAEFLAKDVGAYVNVNLKGSNRTDYLWMNKVMKSGTLPDRMAAYTVRIQDSPVHNIQCLQQLIGQVKVQGKKHCLTTTDTLKDLFLQDLLPPDRKLRLFDEHGAALRTASKKQLVLWAFEDKLKAQYNNFIQALSKMAGDTVDQMRGKSISVMQELLTNHPEQESTLLQMLVNKLGDPVQKVGSRALFHLNKLIIAHPRMKTVVVDEVERLLFRNNVGKRAQYYGICFLNLIHLQEEHPQLSAKLMKVYLGFFKACIKLGEIDSKMMNVLLTGVNKAFPKAQLMGFEFSESVDTLYKIVALSQFNIGVQALAVLQQMVDVKNDAPKADRFYRVLYDLILSPDVGTTARGMKFLNVVYKALATDTLILRVTAIVKRLLQVCHNVPPNIACGILYLISETSKIHRNMFTFTKTTKSKDNKKSDGKGEEDSGDEELNIEALPEKKRIQLEKLAKKSNIKLRNERKIQVPNSGSNVIDLESAAESNASTLSKAKTESQPPQDVDLSIVKTEIRATSYDPLARNPLYCGANLSLTYELVSLCHHFHPSVALFAETLMGKKFIKYDGNPLRDFTVARFLERFVYRNPKVQKMRQQYVPQGLRSIPVNSTEYLQADESIIPAEEKFFYKYFKDRQEKLPKSEVKKRREEDDSDVESVDDDEFDDLMANYFKQTGALAESDGEEDDLDFAADIKSSDKKSKKKGKKDEDSDEDEEDDEETFNDDDGDMDEGSDLDDEEAIDADDFIEMDDNGDELGDEIDFDDFDPGSDLDDNDESPVSSSSKVLSSKAGRKQKLKNLGGNMFLPAEEFADMLDSNADVDITGSHTFVNKDNADMKQLKWESERDRWAKGYKKTSKVSFKSQKSKKRKN